MPWQPRAAAAPVSRSGRGASSAAVLGWLSVAAVLSLVMHLRAVYAGPAWQVYLFKPLTTSLILSLAVIGSRAATARYRGGILAGLFFSLIGDVLLMLPGDRFVPGLIAFLVAHLCYLWAFTDRVGARLITGFTAVYLAAAGVVIAPLWPRLGTLRGPVLAYMAVIMAMASQAGGRWLSLRTRGSRLAAIGAGLFVASDATLAIDRFGGGFAAAPLVVMSTYIAAQLLIAWSAEERPSLA
jgi:uncharacterized membrane protein YhhN